ncbi:MAG: discoidin domain-containing protein [Planctomycetota bacterium]
MCVETLIFPWLFAASGPLRGTARAWGLLVALVSCSCCPAADVSMREQVEADWLRQAQRWAASEQNIAKTVGDAAGAVDGVKNGKYAFHTGLEPNPWWQVDLGRRRAIVRILVFNRLDYGPGLHNADDLRILTSDDGQNWTVRHENQGKHFGGISGAPPLEVEFPEPVTARFVRLGIPSSDPVFLHLDEVEIHGNHDPSENIALNCLADQSSVSQWSTNKITPDVDDALSEFTAHVVRHGLLLADDLARRGVDTAAFRRQLVEARNQLDQVSGARDGARTRKLYLSTRWIIRRLVFRNPLLQFDKLLCVKRFTQETYPDICLNHMPWVSRPGGDICVLSSRGPDSPPRVETLLNERLGPGHVHGVDLDWDAEHIVFGYAQSESQEPIEGWLDRRTNYQLRRDVEPIHLFQMDINGDNLCQLTAGQWSDLDPTFLPSGEIAFVSERCGFSLQCNEFDKDETSCNLYVMRGDGSNIRRLSASKDGDYLPHSLADGSIGYCRWEYQERGWAHIQSIWTVRPDGTGADALFKQHLNEPWALEDVRSVPTRGSRKLVAIAAGHHTLAAGPVVMVTPSVGMNTDRAIRIVTPDILPPEGGMSGRPVLEGGVRDGEGFYMTPWPLSEKYVLAAYSYGDKQNDPTGYGIYLIDVFGNKELLYRDPDISTFSPIPIASRPKPLQITDVADPTVKDATCAVADVSHGVAGVEKEDACYLRISQRLAWPYDNRYGGQRYHEVAHTQELQPNWTPVRVLGDVPVEADGSAHFRVPADTPVYFQLLDENHMELRRMRSFISLQPGERRMCVGCHETRGEAPPSQSFPSAVVRGPSELVPPPWGQQPVSFLRDIQPIFDRHCTECHGGLKPAAGLDFSRGLTARGTIPAFGANRAYETIRVHELVSRSNIHDDASITEPLAFGSHKSKLIQVLRDGSCTENIELTPDEWLRLVTWIDGNAPYHDRFINKRRKQPVYDLPADTGLFAKIESIHQRRCGTCHEAGEVTRPYWVDLYAPEESLFLTAPLARSAGGTQKCGKALYTDRSDEDFAAIAQWLVRAVERAWTEPRRDLRAVPRPRIRDRGM